MLVSSLFLLWGFCNGMIDVMDKHFQQELHLTLAQSAWPELDCVIANLELLPLQ
jgi:fucose permease